jgi:hypothetical protein
VLVHLAQWSLNRQDHSSRLRRVCVNSRWFLYAQRLSRGRASIPGWLKKEYAVDLLPVRVSCGGVRLSQRSRSLHRAVTRDGPRYIRQLNCSSVRGYLCWSYSTLLGHTALSRAVTSTSFVFFVPPFDSSYYQQDYQSTILAGNPLASCLPFLALPKPLPHPRTSSRCLTPPWPGTRRRPGKIF